MVNGIQHKVFLFATYRIKKVSDVMNVWCVNFKDNRNELNSKDCQKKCEFCFKEKILPIGWGYDVDGDLFTRVKNTKEKYLYDTSKVKHFSKTVKNLENLKTAILFGYII